MSVADRSWAHMAGGFLLMGSWAVFANRAHGMPAALMAGVVQGTLTAMITLGLKRMLEGLHARLDGAAALAVPPLAAAVASVTILSVVHTLAGTPEVLATLAVPSTVATVYAALYTWRLHAHG